MLQIIRSVAAFSLHYAAKALPDAETLVTILKIEKPEPDSSLFQNGRKTEMTLHKI
jgi:hypothetical protein